MDFPFSVFTVKAHSSSSSTLTFSSGLGACIALPEHWSPAAGADLCVIDRHSYEGFTRKTVWLLHSPLL